MKRLTLLGLHPTSAALYLRRNLKRVLPVIGVIILATLGISLALNILNSMIDTERRNFESLKIVTALIPKKSYSLSTETKEKVSSISLVNETYPVKFLSFQVDALVGRSNVDLWAVPRNSFDQLLILNGVKLKEGRLPKKNKAEFIVSTEIARARGLKIGQKIGAEVNQNDWLPGSFTLVGIVEGDRRIALTSYEYVAEHQVYASEPEGLLLVAQKNKKEEMDVELNKTLANQDVKISNFSSVDKDLRSSTKNMYFLLAFVEIVIVAIMAVSIALLNYLYFILRLDEFGLLAAIGYTYSQLRKRVLKEIFGISLIGWIIGNIGYFIISNWLRYNFYLPRGMTFDINLQSVLFTAPIPLALSLIAMLPLFRRLKKLDPVEILVRRV